MKTLFQSYQWSKTTQGTQAYSNVESDITKSDSVFQKCIENAQYRMIYDDNEFIYFQPQLTASQNIQSRTMTKPVVIKGVAVLHLFSQSICFCFCLPLCIVFSCLCVFCYYFLSAYFILYKVTLSLQSFANPKLTLEDTHALNTHTHTRPLTIVCAIIG